MNVKKDDQHLSYFTGYLQYIKLLRKTDIKPGLLL